VSRLPRPCRRCHAPCCATTSPPMSRRRAQRRGRRTTYSRHPGRRQAPSALRRVPEVLVRTTESAAAAATASRPLLAAMRGCPVLTGPLRATRRGPRAGPLRSHRGLHLNGKGGGARAGRGIAVVSAAASQRGSTRQVSCTAAMTAAVTGCRIWAVVPQKGATQSSSRGAVAVAAAPPPPPQRRPRPRRSRPQPSTDACSRACTVRRRPRTRRRWWC
jgi:hypothetical protein